MLPQMVEAPDTTSQRRRYEQLTKATHKMLSEAIPPSSSFDHLRYGIQAYADQLSHAQVYGLSPGAAGELIESRGSVEMMFRTQYHQFEPALLNAIERVATTPEKSISPSAIAQSRTGDRSLG